MCCACVCVYVCAMASTPCRQPAVVVGQCMSTAICQNIHQTINWVNDFMSAAEVALPCTTCTTSRAIGQCRLEAFDTPSRQNCLSSTSSSSCEWLSDLNCQHILLPPLAPLAIVSLIGIQTHLQHVTHTPRCTTQLSQDTQQQQQQQLHQSAPLCLLFRLICACSWRWIFTSP